MTRRTRLLTIPLLSLAFASASFAAEEPKPAATGPISAERQLEMLTEALTLTPEQSAKIKPILDRDREKARELRADTALSAEDRRTKRRELSRARMEEIRAVLTPEQQTKLNEVTEKRREEWQKRRAERESKSAK
ncbi:MAG: hypothetical protein ACO1QR_10355 [Chthoniobacteraceae bacterium]